MFRFKRGVKVSYTRQGYIYFASRRYRELPEEERKRIRALCEEHGGEHCAALFEFVTTDATATAVTMKYFISRATLYRVVRKYYEGFFDEL